jgi:hypothetical protein
MPAQPRWREVEIDVTVEARLRHCLHDGRCTQKSQLIVWYHETATIVSRCPRDRFASVRRSRPFAPSQPWCSRDPCRVGPVTSGTCCRIQNESAACRPGPRGAGGIARRVCRAHRPGNREVGQGGQVSGLTCTDGRAREPLGGEVLPPPVRKSPPPALGIPGPLRPGHAVVLRSRHAA